MVAYAYENLGGISSATTGAPQAYSKRGKDMDRYQSFSFQCNPAKPFTGTVVLEGSVSDPTFAPSNQTWFKILDVTLENEGGNFFVQIEVELASIRAVCYPGNYWSAAYGANNGATAADGQFSIDGIIIGVLSGWNPTQVAEAINTNADVIADGSIVADVIGVAAPGQNILRIYRKDGAPFVLANVVGLPLNQLGFTPGTITGGAINAISALR